MIRPGRGGDFTFEYYTRAALPSNSCEDMRGEASGLAMMTALFFFMHDTFPAFSPPLLCTLSLHRAAPEYSQSGSSNLDCGPVWPSHTEFTGMAAETLTVFILCLSRVYLVRFEHIFRGAESKLSTLRWYCAATAVAYVACNYV